MSLPNKKVAGQFDVEFAIERLFRKERGGILRYLSRRVEKQEDAQDVLQEAFVRLVSARPAALAERPEAYLQRIVQNIVIDRFRRSAAYPPVDPLWDEDDPAVGVAPQQGWAIEAEDAMTQYQRALGELPARTREIFELNRGEGLTYQQLAERFGISVKAIEYHMGKALHHLHLAFYGE